MVVHVTEFVEALLLPVHGLLGMMRRNNGRIFTSKTLCGEHVGLEEIDDGIWSVYYGPVLLARFDEREMRFYG